jgi:hypothetical protein
MLGYPIDPIIRDTLDKKRKVLSRTKNPDPFSPRDKESKIEYQKNVIRTPYIFMVSAPVFEADEVKRGKMPTGAIILGSQEYSKDTQAQTVHSMDLYNSRSKIPYRPTAGVKSLSSEYLSSNNVQFIRHITINWSCFSLEDLEVLGERFLTLGRKVYVEWGWATDVPVDGPRPALIDNKGEVMTGKDTDPRESEATRLRIKVIEHGKGDFDAVVGWVNNFNWTSREDGGFDCTTEITVQGINALDGPTDINDDNNDDKPKFRENPDKGTSKFSFGRALMDLPKTMLDNIMSNADPDDKDKSYRHQLLEKYQTATSVTETFEKHKRNEKKDKTTTSFEGVKTQTQDLYTDSKNFIVTKDIIDEMNRALEFTHKNPGGKETFTADTSAYGTTGDILDWASREAPGGHEWWDERTEYPPEKAWVRWGWFEDNILNKFFALIDEKGKAVSWFRSIEKDVDINGQQKYKQLQGARNTLEFRDISLQKVLNQNEDFEKIPLATGLSYENLGKYIIDHKSIMVKNHKDFKTKDINKFIFPGKFQLKMSPLETEKFRNRHISIEAKREKLLNKLKVDGIDNFDAEKANGDKERKLAAEIQALTNELNAIEKYGASSLDEMKLTGENSIETEINKQKITVGNLDPVEQGIVAYQYLATLSKIAQQMKPGYSYNVGDNPDKKGFTKGYLRNIFINVKNLQDIFSNKSATLGENMNALFDSITMETGGMIDLVVGANQIGEVGCLQTQQRGYDKHEAEKLKMIETIPGAMYEFPVMQNDSNVISQELSSDISGENYKILLSKAYDERIKFEKKKGISLMHHEQIGVVDSDGDVIPKKDKYAKVGDGIRPAFTQEGYKNYGEPDGNEDYPLSDKGASVVPDDIIEQSEVDKRNKARNDSTEKDLEIRDNVFKELAINYTADGRLKGDIYDEMKDRLNLRQVTRTDIDGKEYTIVLPNIEEYGMVGLTNTLKMTGIAGLYPSNVFTTTYLPAKFKKHSHFYATDVSQEIDSSTWTTTISGRMVWRYVEVDDLEFGEAFSDARKSGKETFVWRGKSYTTELKKDE